LIHPLGHPGTLVFQRDWMTMIVHPAEGLVYLNELTMG
jgi:hypothetical protein